MKERDELKKKILREKDRIKVVFALYYNVRQEIMLQNQRLFFSFKKMIYSIPVNFE